MCVCVHACVCVYKVNNTRQWTGGLNAFKRN